MPTMCVGAIWGCSSVGRALRSQCRGREFESHQLHHPLHQRCFGWQATESPGDMAEW